MDRRTFLATSAALPFAAAATTIAHAQERAFAPKPGAWRTFEVVTRLDIAGGGPGTQAWIPIPSIDGEWQQSQGAVWTGNMRSAVVVTDGIYGARMVHATFADDERAPSIEVTSRFRAKDRALDWNAAAAVAPDPGLSNWLKATDLMPTDGIVKATAERIVAGRTSDVDRARALYDWVVSNTYREPKVRGCGTGDIKAMLETGNMGGKCGDINALFVGLARSVGIPARDVYGIRVARSAFGYRELGAGGPDISRAQHCRAEAWLAGRGWVAMDPADVGKVMRLETPEWLKDPNAPVAAPVYRALFGGWEGNWMAYNVAHDVALPGSRGAKVGFLMYPQAETRGERIDSLDPETFKYKITAREITA
ncbi:MAG: transglutaminase domain-containing protein [Burkholderiales bacterium]